MKIKKISYLFFFLLGLSVRELKPKKNEKKLSVTDLRYTLDKLYKCRDLEISNLWQRSVFLSVFLILCSTAYGYLIQKSLEQTDADLILSYGLMSLVLSSINIIFSIIWIAMGKGSKAWYEVYESAITNFENDYWMELRMPQNYVMGSMKCPRENLNNSFLSTKAGAFSPSKINIFIGQISLLIWSGVSVFHFISNLEYLDGSGEVVLMSSLNVAIPLLTFVISLLIIYAKPIRSSFI